MDRKQIFVTKIMSNNFFEILVMSCILDHKTTEMLKVFSKKKLFCYPLKTYICPRCKFFIIYDFEPLQKTNLVFPTRRFFVGNERGVKNLSFRVFKASNICNTV